MESLQQSECYYDPDLSGDRGLAGGWVWVHHDGRLLAQPPEDRGGEAAARSREVPLRPPCPGELLPQTGTKVWNIRGNIPYQNNKMTISGNYCRTMEQKHVQDIPGPWVTLRLMPSECSIMPRKKSFSWIMSRTFAEWKVDYVKFDGCHSGEFNVGLKYRLT